jgi:multisubunit Na+/H+ antiporter MnhE subunit
MLPNFWLNFGLAVLWCLLVEEVSIAAFAVGYAVGAVVLVFSRRLTRAGTSSPRRAFQAGKIVAFTKLAVYFIYELIVANLQVSWVIIRPRLRVQPAIIRLPIELEHDLSITALANIISLTPGTLTVDVAADRKSLVIHCLNVDDTEQAKRAIKERIEAPLKELER